MSHPRERRPRVISQAVIEAGVDLRYICVDDLEREILLVLEAMVQGGLWNSRRYEQGLDAQTMVARLQQHAVPAVEQALLGRMHYCDVLDKVPRRSRLRSLALCLFNHVVDDVAMLVLRAEHDDLRVSINPHIVPRWPIEQVIRVDFLLLASRIGRGERAAHHETPMGT